MYMWISTVLNRRRGKWLDVDEALAKEWMASDLVESFLFLFFLIVLICFACWTAVWGSNDWQRSINTRSGPN